MRESAFTRARINSKKRREEAGPLFASHFEAGETEPLRAFSALNPEEGLVDKIDPFGLVEAKAVQNPA